MEAVPLKNICTAFFCSLVQQKRSALLKQKEKKVISRAKNQGSA